MTQQPTKTSLISHPNLGQVRSVMIKGEPYFVAKDVCDVLGLTNSRKSLSALDLDEKGVTISDTLGGKQEMATVNESGLYSLIFQSRKPEAKQFRKWVTSEVLPAIRRQGFYIHPSAQLTTAETKRLQRVMRENVSRYIIAEDVRRTARKFGVPEHQIGRVLRGDTIHNDIMLELQTRALANQQKWSNAYSVARMNEVAAALAK